MSQAANGHDEHADKKIQQANNSAANHDEESSPQKQEAMEPKSKSYAEILKGFEEIEKIFKQDQKKKDM